MIKNKEDIENIIEDTSMNNSDNKFRYWLGKDEVQGLEELIIEAVISDLKLLINKKIEESAKTLNFPWIEFAFPYYISETVLSKICKEYIEKGDWESIRVCRLSHIKEEYHSGEEHYFTMPVTKFIFSFSKEIDKQVRSFYGDEFKDGKWQTIA